MHRVPMITANLPITAMHHIMTFLSIADHTCDGGPRGL